MATKKKMPSTHSLKLGQMVVQKGTNDDGDQIYTWDVAQKCKHDSCPAYEECKYEAALGEDGVCRVMRDYLKSATMVLYEHSAGMTSAQRYQVGMHIMPLYKILCKLKLEEVGVNRVITVSDRGVMSVNPVYKEIRETIKTIDQVWKSIGVTEPVKIPTAPDMGFRRAKTNNSGENVVNYYDAMERAAMAENRG